MLPAEVVRRAAGYLARHDVESPVPTAELLLASVLGTDRSGVYTRAEELTGPEAKLFGRALCRRCAGTPVQHLTGEQGFHRLVLAVRPGVFIPRPETELVVESALEVLAGTDAPVVVDVGTGTGAIALAIARERTDARVLAVDLAPAAVALARENAARLGTTLEVLEGDLLDPLPAELRGGLDLVVSNPPYVVAEHAEALPPEVRADPELALFGGPGIHARLLRQARGWLRPGGAVVVEMGETQGEEVSRIARGAGFEDVRVLPDLTGRDRVLVGRRPVTGDPVERP